MTVAICIATYLRPVMLADLLRSVAALEHRGPNDDIQVIVVDNDAAGSARAVVEQARPLMPWRMTYAIEPIRNIALARNRAVSMALADGQEWLAFVDDDEQVPTHWIDELLRVAQACTADIVGGPVENAYEAGTPSWIVERSLPERITVPTGLSTNVPATSNVLISRKVFGLVRGYFDERFGRSGGSDSHLFLRAKLAGARFAWANEAAVRETLPASRTTAAWLLRRALRTGNTSVFVARAELPLHLWFPRRIAAAVYRTSRGLLRMIPALVQGRGARVDAMQDLCVAMGAVMGMAGHHYIEYDHTHGA